MSRWGGFAKLMVISVHCSQMLFADNWEEPLPLRRILKGYSVFVRIQLRVGTYMFEFISRGYKRDMHEMGQTYIWHAQLQRVKQIDSFYRAVHSCIEFDLSTEIETSRHKALLAAQDH